MLGHTVMNDWQQWSEELTRHSLDAISGGRIDWGDNPLAATHMRADWSDKVRRAGDEIRRRFGL